MSQGGDLGLRPCAAQDCAAPSPGASLFEPRPGGPRFLVRSTGADPWAGRVTTIEPVRFANGAALTGFAALPGEILLQARLPGPVPADAQVFVHALDAAGNKLAQADRPGWPGRYWRAGDTLYLWMSLALPEETARLSVGMYTIENDLYHNIEVVDAQGAYLAQAAELALPGG